MAEIPTGFAAVDFIYNSGGYSGTRLNRVHFQTAAALDGPLPGTEAWHARAPKLYHRYWGLFFAPMLTNVTDLVNVKVATTDRVSEGLDGSLLASGSRTGVTLLPPEFSNVLSLRTGLAGRKYRGRIFLPESAEGDYDYFGNHVGLDAVLETASEGAATFFDDMPYDIDGELMASGQIHIVHSDGSPPTLVTSGVWASRVGRLRSRQR